jgi:putative phosphoesterase
MKCIHHKTVAIALISDIHANKPALEAILKHIKKTKKSYIWNAGDSIGYGPFPNETIALLKQKKIKSILGNYDKMVLSIKNSADILPQHPQKMFAAYWTFQSLSSKSKEYLRKLPEQIKHNIYHWQILLVHGSPASNKEYLDDKTPAKRLAHFAETTKADIIISGHSHRSSYRIIKNTHFINPGSAGRPDDGNPAASYATLYLSKNKIKVKHFRVPYKVSKVISTFRLKELPVTFETMFKEGISMEQASQKHLNFTTEMPAEKLKKAETSIYKMLKKYANKDAKHAKHVAKLGLLLFKLFNKKFGLPEREAIILKYASLLHDIGWCISSLPHHKASMLLILNEKKLHLNPLEKSLVALVARYHRKSEPESTDPLFRKLPAKHKKIVNALASLLRIADALDASHMSIITDISVRKAGRKKILFLCKSHQPLTSEEKSALIKKKGLLAKLIGAKIYFRTKKTKHSCSK